MLNSLKRIAILIFTLTFIISCGGELPQTGEIRTADQPPVELTHLFTLDEPEGYFYRRIAAIESDSQGRIFVVDQQAHKILVYDSGGSYLTTIGGEGGGPEEFRAILRTITDRHDRLVVFDMGNMRSVVYEEENGKWEPVTFLTIDGTRFGAEAVDGDGNVIVRQSIDQMPEPGMSWFVHKLAPAHLESGLTGDQRVEFREMGYLVRDDGFMMGIPFGRTTLLAAGNDGRYYMTWNDRFDVEVYNMNLELIDSVSAEIPNLEVSSEEREEAIERAGDRFRSLAREHTPETKPVATQMWVDRNRNFWLQTHDSPEYLVLDSSGEPIGSFDLESDRRIMHVDGDRVYSLLSDDDGFTLDVYEVRFDH